MNDCQLRNLDNLETLLRMSCPDVLSGTCSCGERLIRKVYEVSMAYGKVAQHISCNVQRNSFFSLSCKKLCLKRAYHCFQWNKVISQKEPTIVFNGTILTVCTLAVKMILTGQDS